MVNSNDITIPDLIRNFELMNNIEISMKDLRRIATCTLLQKEYERKNQKKPFIKIIKGVNKYE